MSTNAKNTAMTPSATATLMATVITVLALADGALHFSLDFVLFRGRFFGSGFPGGPPGGSAPPPGAARPSVQLPLPLNEMFLLNFIGYVVLILVFWFGSRWLGARRWLVDVVLVVYATAAFVAWLEIGRPNPLGLGYISKGIEVALIIALIAHIWSVVSQAGAPMGPPNEALAEKGSS